MTSGATNFAECAFGLSCDADLIGSSYVQNLCKAAQNNAVEWRQGRGTCGSKLEEAAAAFLPTPWFFNIFDDLKEERSLLKPGKPNRFVVYIPCRRI
jgi:hypothetical protein